MNNVATTCARNISNSGVHKVSMSDHYMVFCVRKFEGALQEDRKIIKTRSIKKTLTKMHVLPMLAIGAKINLVGRCSYRTM